MDSGTWWSLLRLGFGKVATVVITPAASGPMTDINMAEGLSVTILDLPNGFTGGGLSFALAPSSAPLPAGLSLAANGILSGLPTELVTDRVITIRATNSEGFADNTVRLTVFALDFTAGISGLTANPTHGPSAQTGVVLTASTDDLNGPLPVTVAYQWATVESGPIAGATAATYAPDAALHDGETLYCSVDPDFYPSRTTATAVVRRVPPILLAPIAPEIYDQGTGDQLYDVSGYFSGDALTYTVAGMGVSVDALTGVLTISTDTALAGESVTVTAENSGGPVTGTFLVTVEAVGAGLTFENADWALSGPRPDGVDVVIFDVPGAPSDIEYRVNGGAWTSMGGAVPGSYAITGLAVPGPFRVELRPLGESLDPSPVKSFDLAPGDPRGFRGWDPQADFGTIGDVFVDGLVGDDANSGASIAVPKRTIAAALATVTSGQVVKVRAGTYRERVTIPFGVELSGYGTEKPLITAQEPLTGWTQCTSPADDVLIGTALASSGNVFKRTGIPKPGGYSEIMAINPFEAGKRLYHATDRADMSDLFTRGDEATYHVADAFILNASNQITGVVDASVINAANYTDAQLVGARVYLYHSPNVSNPVTITAADVANNEITVDGLLTVQGNTATPAADDLRFAILNCARNLTAGTFAVIDQGATFDLYVFPNDPDNIELIEYSTRERVLELSSGASNDGITIRGVHVHGATGEDSGGGLNIYKGDSSATSSNHRISNVLSTGCENFGQVARSIRFVRVDDTYVENCTMYDMITGRGCFFSSTSAGFGKRNMVRACVAERMGGAGIYAYDQQDYVCAHNLFKDNGLDAHSNKSNHYGPAIGFDGLLFWGNEFDNAQGYIVWQNAASPNVAFNFAPVKQAGPPWNRTITDDNQNFAAIPVNNSTGRIFNNTVPPTFGMPESGKAIDLARPQSDIVYRIANNVTHGVNSAFEFDGTNNATPQLLASNVITFLDTGQSVLNFAAENQYAPDLSVVYADYANGDYSPAAGSPILSTPGTDMSGDVAAIAARFAHFQGTDKDFKNAPISWATPFVGSDSGLNFTTSTGGGGAALVATQELVNDTSYRAASGFTYASGTHGGTTYTPASAGNTLVFCLSAGAMAAAPIVRWRGVVLSPAIENLDPALYMDYTAIFVVDTPGDTEGVFTVEQAVGSDSNLCIAHVSEFSGLAAAALVQTSAVESSTSTNLTEEDVVVLSTASGNIVAGMVVTGGNALSPAPSTGTTLGLSTATGASGNSDNRLSSLHRTSGGGNETLGITFDSGSHSLAMAVELASA